jgi:hypothetical protein
VGEGLGSCAWTSFRFFGGGSAAGDDMIGMRGAGQNLATVRPASSDWRRLSRQRFRWDSDKP